MRARPHTIGHRSASLAASSSFVLSGPLTLFSDDLEDLRRHAVLLIVLSNPVTVANRGLIIALMARHRLPAVYPYPYYVREGGLVSYGTDAVVQFRQAASYVDRILKGGLPRPLLN
jgi:ABC-type uncharacterized transport system substrate-binding protein